MATRYVQENASSTGATDGGEEAGQFRDYLTSALIWNRGWDTPDRATRPDYSGHRAFYVDWEEAILNAHGAYRRKMITTRGDELNLQLLRTTPANDEMTRLHLVCPCHNRLSSHANCPCSCETSFVNNEVENALVVSIHCRLFPELIVHGEPILTVRQSRLETVRAKSLLLAWHLRPHVMACATTPDAVEEDKFNRILYHHLNGAMYGKCHKLEGIPHWTERKTFKDIFDTVTAAFRDILELPATCTYPYGYLALSLAFEMASTRIFNCHESYLRSKLHKMCSCTHFPNAVRRLDKCVQADISGLPAGPTQRAVHGSCQVPDDNFALDMSWENHNLEYRMTSDPSDATDVSSPVRDFKAILPAGMDRLCDSWDPQAIVKLLPAFDDVTLSPESRAKEVAELVEMANRWLKEDEEAYEFSRVKTLDVHQQCQAQVKEALTEERFNFECVNARKRAIRNLMEAIKRRDDSGDQRALVAQAAKVTPEDKGEEQQPQAADMTGVEIRPAPTPQKRMEKCARRKLFQDSPTQDEDKEPAKKK